MNYRVVALSAFAAALVAADAQAGFVVPNGVNYPWVRGTTPNSSYAGWESFSSRSGPNVPDAGTAFIGVTPAGAQPFNLFDSGTTSTVLGTGNLYGGFGQMFITVNAPGFGFGPGAATTTLLLQTRTQGTEINPASVNVDGVAPTSVTELSRISLGQQGAEVETLWQFTLTSSPANYTIHFDSTMQFMSLDAVAVDIYSVVPTPGAGAVIGLAALGAARRRR